MLDLLLFSGVTDPDVKQWVQAVRSAGGRVSTARAALMEKLVKGLKADGLWPLLDELWIFAAENGTQARTGVKARVLAAAVNSPPFTTNRGYAGDGLSAYLDLNINPSTAAGRFTRNDASYGAWIVIQNSVTGARLMGYDGLNGTELRYNAAANYGMGINSASYTPTGIASTSLGLMVATRVGASGAGSQNTYYNGANLVADNQASTALPNWNFFALGTSQFGGIAAPCDARLGVSFIGGSLTAVQVTSLYSRLRTHMTAVGVP